MGRRRRGWQPDRKYWGRRRLCAGDHPDDARRALTIWVAERLHWRRRWSFLHTARPHELLIAAGGGGGGGDGCSGCKEGGRGEQAGPPKARMARTCSWVRQLLQPAAASVGAKLGGTGGIVQGSAANQCSGQPGIADGGGAATGTNGNCDPGVGAYRWESGGGQGNGGGGGGGAGYFGGGGAGFIWTYCSGGVQAARPGPTQGIQQPPGRRGLADAGQCHCVPGRRVGGASSASTPGTGPTGESSCPGREAIKLRAQSRQQGFSPAPTT